VARRIAVVPQTPQAPFSFTAREMVTMGRFAHGTGLGGGGRRDWEAVDRALAFTDTHHLAERPVDQLSGGELQRVVLARALAQETPVLLLDEATSQLDIRHRIEVGELLLRLHRDEGKTVVQVTHDLDLAAEVSHRMLLLGPGGKTVAQGTPTEVMQPSLLRQAFGVGIHTDRNPLTGAIRLTPMFRRAPGETLPLRVHVLCGGGSGAEILRRLYVLGTRISAGPLNQGDTDHRLATALGAAVTEERPFSPLGPAVLAEAGAQLAGCDAVVIAAAPWGPGNAAVLDLALEACGRGTPLVLVAPDRGNDFTGGNAWDQLQKLRALGAVTVDDAEGLLEVLEPLWHKETP
jgi:iron complex transport system ATP-binding protein